MKLPANFISKYCPILRPVLFFGIILSAAWLGSRARQWWYPASAPYRFRGDIANAWNQGTGVCLDAGRLQGDFAALRWGSFLRGYLGRYDRVISSSPDGNYRLDYPPGRLLIMSLWVKDKMGGYFPLLSDPADEKFARPLLWIDTIAEFSGAVLAFFIVRLVLSRGKEHWANWLALAAALLLWFNPAVFVDRVWPQWDAWVLPFYLGAGLLALNRRWIQVGICIGVGMMFKGQVICTAAIFVLWPLFQGNWRAGLEVIMGAVGGLMVCVSPWLIRTPLAGVFLTFMLVAAVVVGFRFIRGQWRVILIGFSIPVAIFLSGLFFGGSFGWWYVPFVYSSHHFPLLAVGTPLNLPVLLAERWHWRLHDIVWASNRFHLTVTMRGLLVCVYALGLVACSFGLARQDARKDRRVLIALATPWVLMFAFMPQMHERYLYWGAALTALAAGVSLGATLLHLAVTFLACVAMGNWIAGGKSAGASFLHGMFPDSGWAVVLIALIFLYLSITRSPGVRESDGAGTSAPRPDRLPTNG